MEVTRRDKWQRLKSWNRHVPSALTWCVGISAMHCSSHMTSGPLTQPSMDAPHGHRYWRRDPTVLPISSQHPGAQLVLTTGADGELLHHLRPHSNFSISFRVVCVSKPGAAHIPGPKHPLSRTFACGRWWAYRVCWARTLGRRNQRGRPTSPSGTTRCAFSLCELNTWRRVPDTDCRNCKAKPGSEPLPALPACGVHTT